MLKQKEIPGISASSSDHTLVNVSFFYALNLHTMIFKNITTIDTFV